MGSSAPDTQTVTNRTEPDPITQQWRQQVFGAGANLWNQGVPSYYPNSTVTPFSTQTQAGLNYLQNYAQQGAPNLAAANGAMAGILSGANPGAPYAQNAAGGGLNAAGQVQPMIRQGMANNPFAGQLANAGERSNPWDNFIRNMGTAQTTAGTNLIRAGAGPTTAGVGAIQGAGQTDATRGLNLMRSAAQGTTRGMGILERGATAEANDGRRQLALTASGRGGNQYLDSLFQAASAPVTDAVNANFAQAGRFGANAAHTGALTRELGSLAQQIYVPAMEAERGRQVGAATQLGQFQRDDLQRLMAGGSELGQFQQADMARRLAAGGQLNEAQRADLMRQMQSGGMLADIDQGDDAQRLQAGGMLANLQQGDRERALQSGGMLGDMFASDRAAAMGGYQGAGSLFEAGAGRDLDAAQFMGGMYAGDADRSLQGASLFGDMYDSASQRALAGMALLPSVYNYGQMPGQTMMGVGAQYEDLARQYTADDMARWNYNANAPWDYLQRFSGMMSGLPDFSSTSTTGPGQPGQNRFMSGAGGALAGAQLGSMFMPGIGTGLGAGIGLLGGLFG